MISFFRRLLERLGLVEPVRRSFALTRAAWDAAFDEFYARSVTQEDLIRAREQTLENSRNATRDFSEWLKSRLPDEHES